MSFITINVTSINNRTPPVNSIALNVEYIERFYDDGNGGSIIYYNDDVLLSQSIYYSSDSYNDILILARNISDGYMSYVNVYSGQNKTLINTVAVVRESCGKGCSANISRSIHTATKLKHQ